jgi:hypothetical protein
MLALAFTLAAAAAFGPEFALSAPVPAPAPPLRNLEPAVASNGTDFLVVWNGPDYGAYTARVGGDGTVHPMEPLPNEPDEFWPWRVSPSVASDGRDYVVAYNDGPDVRLARVDSASGKVTDGDRIAEIVYAAIASNGDGYLLAYKDGGRLEAVLVDADARIVGGPFQAGFTGKRPAIATNGESYLIVAPLTHSDLTATLVTNGRIARSETLAIVGRGDPAFYSWSVASDGDGFLVAWAENKDGGIRGGFASAVRVRNVGADGSPEGPARTIVEKDAWEPAVTWDRSRYLVSYSDSRETAWSTTSSDLRAIALDAEGGRPMALAVSEDVEGESAAATNGPSTLIVWTRRRWREPGLIEGRFLGQPVRLISKAPAWQESIDATAHRSGTVVVWSETAAEESRRSRIILQRLDAGGAPRDGAGIPVHESPHDQVSPKVAGSLVVWAEWEPGRTSIRAKMLDGSGAPYGEAYRLGDDGHMPSLAVAGNAHLVVWNSVSREGIVARRIDPYAQTISEPFFVSRDAGDTGAAVVSDGLNFLVTWLRDDGKLRGNAPKSAHASLVMNYGIVVGAPLEIASATTIYQAIPVWNGSHYAVFWSSAFDGVYSRAVRRSGFPTGPARSLVAEYWDGLKNIVWSGTGYQLVTQINSIVSLDRSFRELEENPIPLSIISSSPVVLANGFVFYLSSAGGSRAMARRYLR